jgi:hypothetical protein
VPPQSSPVSLPFLTPSSHAGEAHTPSSHRLELQSVAPLQSEPALHGKHAPPQSTSDSSPSFASLPQVSGSPGEVGAWQMCFWVASSRTQTLPSGQSTD